MQCRAAALKGPTSCRTRDDFLVSFHPSSRPNEALSATLRKLSKNSQIILRVFLPLQASIEAFWGSLRPTEVLRGLYRLSEALQIPTIRWLGGLEGWRVILSGRISIWWTVLGDWEGWRGDGWFFLVGYRFGGLCYVIGRLEGWQVILSGRISIWWTVLGDWGAGGVTGDSYWSDIDLVDCVPRIKFFIVSNTSIFI